MNPKRKDELLAFLSKLTLTEKKFIKEELEDEPCLRKLPEEVFLSITRFLSVKDTLTLEGTCRAFRKCLTQSVTVWWRLLVNAQDFNQLIPMEKSLVNTSAASLKMQTIALKKKDFALFDRKGALTIPGAHDIDDFLVYEGMIISISKRDRILGVLSISTMAFTRLRYVVSISCLKMHHDNIICGHFNGSITIYRNLYSILGDVNADDDREGGEEQQILSGAHFSSISSILPGGGTLIYSAGKDGQLVLWDSALARIGVRSNNAIVTIKSVGPCKFMEVFSADDIIMTLHNNGLGSSFFSMWDIDLNLTSSFELSNDFSLTCCAFFNHLLAVCDEKSVILFYVNDLIEGVVKPLAHRRVVEEVVEETLPKRRKREEFAISKITSITIDSRYISISLSHSATSYISTISEFIMGYDNPLRSLKATKTVLSSLGLLLSCGDGIELIVPS